MLICEICNKQFKHLGSHIWHKHRMLARDYKMEFGLDITYSLITEEIKEKKRQHYNENKEKYLGNLLKYGKKHRFKKGESRPKVYFSIKTAKRILDNLEKMNKRKVEKCMVCNVKTKHLPSHLYNAHGLWIVNERKFRK